MPSRARAAVVVALAGLVPSDAFAYCLQLTCSSSDPECVNGAKPLCDRGTTAPPENHLIHWKTGCTGFSVQKDGGPNISPALLDELIRRAFDNWQNVDCGGGMHPGIYSVDMGPVNCKQHEYNHDSGAGNQNAIIVRAMAWPYPRSVGDYIALTTITWDPTTGELLDTDMELNAANFNFTTSDTVVDTDLLSVLQHETGHFFGLAHSLTEDSTMRPDYPPPDMALALRTLQKDDIKAICTLYPPDPTVTPQCNPLGRHGFSPDCRSEQTEGTCAYAPSKTPSGVGGILLLGAAGAFLRRTRC